MKLGVTTRWYLLVWRPRWWMILVAACACSACDATDGDSNNPSRTQMFDSAGIEVVVSASESLNRQLDWFVSSEPDLQIGTVSGSADRVFDDVRGERSG